MICVPIKNKNINTIIKKLIISQKNADLTEIFFDEISNINVEKLKKIFNKKNKPIIYKSYGYLPYLEQVLAFAPEYIDLDINTSIKIINFVKKISPKTKIIISYHNFETTPPINVLEALIKKMKQKKADIFKIATYANEISDSIKILSFLSTKKQLDIICLAMGKYGKITRATGHLLGNYLMYAPLDEKDKTASGQIILKELKKCHLK